MRAFFFLLAAFKILYLSLILDSFIVMFLGEDCFELRFWSDLLASGTEISKSLPRFGKFSDIICLNKLSASFSFSPSSGTPMMCRLFLLVEYNKSHRLFSFFYSPLPE